MRSTAKELIDDILADKGFFTIASRADFRNSLKSMGKESLISEVHQFKHSVDYGRSLLLPKDSPLELMVNAGIMDLRERALWSPDEITKSVETEASAGALSFEQTMTVFILPAFLIVTSLLILLAELVSKRVQIMLA